MAVWGDEVAKQLDEKFREQIEKIVGDVRSTITDIREVIDQQLDAAMQSVQADANSMSSRPMLAAVLADIEPPVSAAPPVVARADASKVRDGVRAIEQGRSQVEVLNALLEQCTAFGSRAALLILKGDSFSGWKGSGFTRTGGNDEAVKRFSAPSGTVPELDLVLRDEHVVTWDGADFAAKLGASAPTSAVVVPMVIKDKISAAMYVDAVAGEEASFDQAAVEMLVFSTGLLIDTLAVRKKVPSPSLSGGVAVAAPAAAPTPVAAAPAPRPAAPVAAPAPPPAPAAPPPRPAPSFALNQVPVVPPSPRPAPPPAPPNLQTTAIPAMREPVAPAPPPRPAAPSGEEESKPSTQFVPPPGLRGGAAAIVGQQNEAARKHDEARRFARLLVSEIKLYNEAKVEQGRKNKDLYERLKEDIDRSRQMYDERIPDDVRKASNYFYEELVRILADGDSGALGL
ncbi:MAG: hypothetical protein NDJ92_17895 [Thermoanaerobaculia bacterium]|nr:hypothetical protein [Thermoanaerobaculia bacterium]